MNIFEKLAIVLLLISVVVSYLIVIDRHQDGRYASEVPVLDAAGEVLKEKVVEGVIITEPSDELKEVFELLKSVMGPRVQDTTLWINESSRAVQAITWGDGSIVLHRGILTFTRDFPQQLYSIMAHELAHWSEGQMVPNSACYRSNEAHRECEKIADIAGKQAMKDAGLNECAGADLWHRMFISFGDHGGVTHPRFAERYVYLRCE